MITPLTTANLPQGSIHPPEKGFLEKEVQAVTDQVADHEYRSEDQRKAHDR